MLGLKLIHVSKRGHWSLHHFTTGQRRQTITIGKVWPSISGGDGITSPTKPMIIRLRNVDHDVFMTGILFLHYLPFVRINQRPSMNPRKMGQLCGALIFLWLAWTSRHQMETFSVLPSLCAGNQSVTGEFPAQRPVTWSFDVFFDLRLNKRLSKQSLGW